MSEMTRIHAGETESGFAFEIEHERVDNYELLEELVAMREDGSRIIPVARMLLGEEQLARLKEHCRGESGIVPVTAIERELNDIFVRIKQAKN